MFLDIAQGPYLQQSSVRSVLNVPLPQQLWGAQKGVCDCCTAITIPSHCGAICDKHGLVYMKYRCMLNCDFTFYDVIHDCYLVSYDKRCAPTECPVCIKESPLGLLSPADVIMPVVLYHIC